MWSEYVQVKINSIGVTHCFFSDWLEASGRNSDYEMFESEELCQILRQFYADVRQKNGNKYSRSGLTNIRASLQRHKQQM